MTQNERKFYLLGQKYSLETVKSSLDHVEKFWGFNKKSFGVLLDNMIEDIKELQEDNENNEK